jgi:nucleotide-binding universal stress UspA family protein
MQQILVPVDFSATSLKALRFALHQFQPVDAEISIMHHASILELAPDSAFTGLYVPPPTDQLEYTRKELNRFTDKALKGYEKKWPKENIRQLIIPGIGSPDTIVETQKKQKADLIIMGSTGASGLKKWFVGSVAAKVIELSTVPVLVIPQYYKLKQVRKIGYASDLHNIQKDLEHLKPISEVLHAGIAMFHVEPVFPSNGAFKKFNAEKEVSALKQRYNLPDLSYQLIKTRNENDLFAGIAQFRRKSKPDILAVITHKRNWMGKIVNPSQTRTLAYQSKLPLLAIH